MFSQSKAAALSKDVPGTMEDGSILATIPIPISNTIDQERYPVVFRYQNPVFLQKLSIPILMAPKSLWSISATNVDAPYQF